MINIPAVQNFLVHEVTSRLSQQLKTRVEINRVSFRLFNSMDLQGTLIEDQHKDTLLYAGNLKVRITDWFFFQDRPVIKFIGLENAQINLFRSRNDSLWNYHFLEEAFGSSTTSTGSHNPQGISLDLKKMDFRNIQVKQVDAWVGEDMKASIKHLYLDAKNLDLRQHNIAVQELLLEEPVFLLSSYTASPFRHKSTAAPAPATSQGPQLRWNSTNWKLLIEKLHIKNGLLGIDNLDDTTKIIPGYFAPHHIRFDEINLSLTNTSLVKDSLIGNLTLKTKERSGFEVKKMTSRFKMSPVEMEFSRLDMETNRSHIGDYYTMQYNDLSDMSDYVNSVFMQAHFKNCKLSSDDIAFFAPPLTAWKKEITLTGKARGPVSNLKATEINLQSGKTTHLKGNLEMRGLPDIDETFINFYAEELVTTGQDIIQIMPIVKEVKAVRIDRLTSLHFKGNYTGFINDFVAYGQFQTNLGKLNTDLNFKTSRDVPVYSGSLTAANFNIGKLLDNNNLSTISLNAKINGAGFAFKSLKASVDANIQEISLFGYTYRNIKTKGEMSRKFFNGFLTANDPNLDMDFTGTIDFNKALPVFNFNSQIRKCDLKALHFTKDSVTLQAKLDLNFAGNNIDNFNGVARMYEVSVFKNNHRLEFDSLNISTRLQDNTKILEFEGSEISGYVKGDYSFLHLPDAFQLLLSTYYPSFFRVPQNTSIRQNFSFAMNFGQVDKLLKGFTNQFSGFNQTKIAGTLNTINNGKLALNISIPEAGYLNYQVQDLLIQGEGDFNKVNVSTSIGKVLSGKNVIIQKPVILASSGHDTSFVKVDLQAEDTAELNGFYARVITVPDGMKINFLNSAFTVNERQWNVAPGNEIYWSKHFLTVKNLRVTRNDQSITVETNEYNPDESKFIITLKNLNLADVIPSQLFVTRIEGVTDGIISVTDPTQHLDVSASLQMKDLRIDNDSIGIVLVDGAYQHQTGNATFAIRSDNEGKVFLAQGQVGLSATNNTMNTNILLNGASISLLNKYFTGYVSNLSGTVTGDLKITGTTSQPSVKGTWTLDTVGVTVDYLGAHYKIPQLNVKFDDNLIAFGNFLLIDKYNTTGTASGYINHDHFDKLFFNFDVSGTNFLFLNTTAADNELFYGNVLADGKIYFSGPLNDMQMHITARPKKGTHFYLPMTDSKDIGKYDYIIFKSYGTALEEKKKKKGNTKLTVKLDIAANPDAQIDVILDATTGDIISANGTGNLQIAVNTEGDFSMFGNYEINNGSYNFNFQRLTSWKFDIEKNSTINWNGVPQDAKVNITAKYVLPKVSLYNLVGQGTNITTDKLATRTERVDVEINLRGALMKPDITYSIKLPEVGSLAYESGVAAHLKEINNDQNKALFQVWGLLFSNQFLPDDATTSAAANVGITGKNSVGQALSAQAQAILNNITGSLLKGSGIGVNVNYRAYNVGGPQETSSVDRNQLSAGITSNLFNNRFRLYAGGDYDWGKTATAANSNRFAGDFRIEYLLTPDGRFRINAFSKSDYDVYNLNNRTKSGIGISYIREYNKFNELFFGKRKNTAQGDSSNTSNQPGRKATKP